MLRRGIAGPAGRGSLVTDLKNKNLVRLFSGIRQALEGGRLENAYWLPSAEIPADGLTKVRSDIVPFLR